MARTDSEDRLSVLATALAAGCRLRSPEHSVHQCLQDALGLLAGATAATSVELSFGDDDGLHRVAWPPGGAPVGGCGLGPGPTSCRSVSLAGEFGTALLRLAGEPEQHLTRDTLLGLLAGLVRLSAECDRRDLPEPLLIARTLGEISNALSNSVPLEQLLERLVRSAGSLLRVDRVSIFLYEWKRGTFSAHTSWGTGGPATQLASEPTSVERQILASREPVVIQDTALSAPNPYFARLGVQSSLEVPMIAGNQVIGIICCHTIERRRHFTDADVLLATTFANEAAVAILNNQLYERTRASHQRMLSLYQASRVMRADLDLPRVARAILRSATHVAGVPVAVLALPSAARPLIQAGAEADAVAAWRLALPDRTVGQIHQAQPDRPIAAPGWAGIDVVGCSLALDVGEGELAWLELYAADVTPLQDAAPTLLALGQHAGSTLKNARLVASLEQARGQLRVLVEQLVTAREEESRRVAYDVHDSLGQVLVGADQHLQAALHAHRIGDHARGHRELETGRGLVARAIGEARAIVNRLRPPGLDELGLEAALRSYCAELGRHADVEIALDVTFPQQLAATHEAVLFRIVQEALTNAVRHGRAQAVRIQGAVVGRDIVLSVEDDGVGPGATGMLDLERPRNGAGVGGTGLIGMRERARLLGGGVDLMPRAGRGAILMARLPVMTEDRANG